jgi:ribosomal protein S18 acetylase RimI-like enzyme
LEIRPFVQDDLAPLIELTIETFEPFYEEYFRPAVGEVVFARQHGGWRDDYRRQVPAFHDPTDGKYVAVAANGSAIVGYVGWNVDPVRERGEIEIVAVSEEHRGRRIGTALCDHAIADMKRRGARMVAIGTGGDDFHAPARALYERLGCTPYPVTVYFREL